MINNVKAFGKFLDQPMLIAKLNKSLPVILTGAGSLFMINKTKDVFEKTSDDKERKKQLLEHGLVLVSAITSALMAPKIASKITNRMPLDSIEKVKLKNSALVDEFIKNNKADEDIKIILNKAKEEVLSLSEVKKVTEKCNKDGFVQKLIPDPENVSANDIFSEIGYLSIYGAVPVVGGILGGVGADAIAKENVKEKAPDKIKEGVYQYLANIFMCNIGAGTALAILEKMGITSKIARAAAMCAGIAIFGIIGGSRMANLFSKKILNPILHIKNDEKERHPEILDIGLHTDDIATVSLLSGLKWIEPMLPTLYSVSGYRAGIGYRN